MEKFRKPDQYYFDRYDRSTIKALKELEKKSDKPIKHPRYEREGFIMEEDYDPTTLFYDAAANYAKHRDSSVRKRILEDERKDRLVDQNPIPNKIKCNTCGSIMFFSTYFFDHDNQPILFLFDCPKNHSPKKVLYPNGQEYYWPESKCEACGGKFTSQSVETKEKVICTDTCNDCGKISLIEFDCTSEPEEQITDDDRKKYCTAFVGRKTLWDSMLEVAALGEAMQKSDEEKLIKEKYGIKNIEKINIPQLELRLNKLVNEIGYVKFQFEKPEIKGNVVIPFCIQDPTERNPTESIKILSKAIRKELFNSNWRLIVNCSKEISYRLGFLTGHLKGFETDEDLLKIAKEIFEKKK